MAWHYAKHTLYAAPNYPVLPKAQTIGRGGFRLHSRRNVSETGRVKLTNLGQSLIGNHKIRTFAIFKRR